MKKDTMLPVDEFPDILIDANQIVKLLHQNNFLLLSTYVNIHTGVRFSPYAFVDIKHDRALSREQLKTGASDTAKYLWGCYDGTGDPIEMSIANYFKRFVYNKDYLFTRSISINLRIEGSAGTIDNSHEIYPEGTIVEYYLPGQSDVTDWGSLRLVLSPKSKDGILVGIIHDEWTT